LSHEMSVGGSTAGWAAAVLPPSSVDREAGAWPPQRATIAGQALKWRDYSAFSAFLRGRGWQVQANAWPWVRRATAPCLAAPEGQAGALGSEQGRGMWRSAAYGHVKTRERVHASASVWRYRWHPAGSGQAHGGLGEGGKRGRGGADQTFDWGPVSSRQPVAVVRRAGHQERCTRAVARRLRAAICGPAPARGLFQQTDRA
jgi:hypothetical protein